MQNDWHDYVTTTDDIYVSATEVNARITELKAESKKQSDGALAAIEVFRRQLADTIATIANLKEEIKNPTYCTTCGNCGEEGCCGIHKCQYPQDTPETIERIAELEDQLAATKEQQ